MTAVDLNKISNRAAWTSGEATLDDQGLVNVDGDLEVRSNLTVAMGTVSGNVYAAKKGLTTLKNFPHTVMGFCNVSLNPLDSLEGCPTTVKGRLGLLGCGLTSLLHCGQGVSRLNASNNKLTNLKHLPSGLADLSISHNPELHDLSELTPVYILLLSYDKNTGLLPVLQANNLRWDQPLDNPAPERFDVGKILAPYLGKGRSAAIACAAELAKAGFKGNARW